MCLPYHIVPTSPEPSGDDDDATDDEKQTEGSACGGCDDDDDDAYDVDAEVDDDYADYENNEIDSDTGDDDDDDNEDEEEEEAETSKVGEDTETHDKTRDSDDLTGMCSAGKAIPTDNFLPVEEVLDLLTGDTLQTVHASVPLGRKENQWFLVENSEKIIRRKVGENLNTGMTVGRGVIKQKQAHHLQCTLDKTGMS